MYCNWNDLCHILWPLIVLLWLKHTLHIINDIPRGTSCDSSNTPWLAFDFTHRIWNCSLHCAKPHPEMLVCPENLCAMISTENWHMANVKLTKKIFLHPGKSFLNPFVADREESRIQCFLLLPRIWWTGWQILLAPGILGGLILLFAFVVCDHIKHWAGWWQEGDLSLYFQDVFHLLPSRCHSVVPLLLFFLRSQSPILNYPPPRSSGSTMATATSCRLFSSC